MITGHFYFGKNRTFLLWLDNILFSHCAPWFFSVSYFNSAREWAVEGLFDKKVGGISTFLPGEPKTKRRLH
jgi:hypothetical protein